jgi:hypothetical protein
VSTVIDSKVAETDLRESVVMVRYYDIDAANARVEEVRPVLESLRADRDEIAEAQRDLVRFRESNGSSDHAAELARKEQHVKEIVRRMELAVAQIEAWSVTLRDIGTGLIDFPALVSGRPIWLCWRLGEGNIDWWHEFDSGFSSRRPIAELF